MRAVKMAISFVRAGLALAALMNAGTAAITPFYIPGETLTGIVAVAVDAEGNTAVVGYKIHEPSRRADVAVYRIRPDGSVLFKISLGNPDFDDYPSTAVSDPVGNTYLGGFTRSPDFPGDTPVDFSTLNIAAFVIKLDRQGKLAYARQFLSVEIRAMTVDAEGNAYVVGSATGRIAPQRTFGGGRFDAFVMKLDPGGNLLWSAYIGGTGDETATGVAVDRSGGVLVAGTSTPGSFPIGDPLSMPRLFAVNGFIAKLNSAGNRLEYDARLPLLGRLSAAVDAMGNVYVSDRSAPDFRLEPSPGAFHCCMRGGSDVVLMKFAPTSNSLLFAAFLGSIHTDSNWGLGVDASGNAVVVGTIDAPGRIPPKLEFPETPGFVQAPVPGYVFVAAISGDGTRLIYSTGQSGLTGLGSPISATVDVHGRVYVAGAANSPIVTAPGTPPATYRHGGAAVLRIEPPRTTPAHLRIVSGDGQAVEIGARSRDPLVVQVTDERGFPVAGVSVIFRGHRPTSSDVEAYTGETGHASAHVVIDDGPGVVSFTVSLPGLSQTVALRLTARQPPSIRLPSGHSASKPSYSITTVAGMLGKPFTTTRSLGGLAVDKAGRVFATLEHGGDHVLAELLPDASVAVIARVSGESVAVAPSGELYVGAYAGNRIYKISREGRADTYADIGRPGGICFDPQGTLYVSSQAQHSVYAVTTSGTRRIAGSGVASESDLNLPGRIACDNNGNVFIADRGNNRIRRVDRQGGMVTVAGGGKERNPPAGAKATDLFLQIPTGLAVDPVKGDLYISRESFPGIWKVDQQGQLAEILFPRGSGRAFALALDSSGRLYMADNFTGTLHRSNAAGVLQPWIQPQEPPSGVKATQTSLQLPVSVAVDSQDQIFVGEITTSGSEATSGIRRVDRSGIIQTIRPAPNPSIVNPLAMTFDRSGRLFIGHNNNILRLGDSGILSPYSNISLIRGLAFDAQGAAYGMFRTTATAQSPSGLVIYRTSETFDSKAFVHVSGALGFGYAGDGGPSYYARWSPESQGLALDRAENLYFCDTGNHRVRRIDKNHIITTIAGTGVRGFSGDGGPAGRAQLNDPRGVAVDAAGNLLIADTGNHRVRLVDNRGEIITIAGTGVTGFIGEGGPSHLASLSAPQGVFADAKGNIFIADTWNYAIRKLSIDSAAVERPIHLLNAASFQTGPAAPESLVTLAGTNLTESVIAANRLPLPTEVAGYQISVRDAAQRNLAAPIHSVAPEQLNFLVPRGSSTGIAKLTVNGPAQLSATFPFQIAAVSPGIFTASSNGRGAPAATVERVAQTGERFSERAFECGGTGRSCVPKRIEFGAPGDAVVLVLYGTGIRGHSDPGDIEAWIGGVRTNVLYAGPQGSEGLDQVNLLVPGTLAGRGLVDVVLSVNGRTANPVWIDVGSERNVPPVISWDFYTDPEGWIPQKIVGSRVEGGIWYLDPRDIDPYIEGPKVTVSAEDYPYVQVRMSAKCQGRGDVLFRTAATDSASYPYSGERSVSFEPKPCVSCTNAPFEMHSIRMADHPLWKGVITGIRLDPCDVGVAGSDIDTVAVDYIRLSPMQ